MAYPASLLINRAYNLSGIVARDFEETSGSQGSDGLFLLNELLDFQSTDMKLIPYYKRTVLNLVQGQEMYFIPNLLYVDSLTFNIGSVRYSLIENTRREYFAGPRVDNIQSLPYSYRIERCLDGSNIYLYFIPEAVYVMQLSAKYALTEVTLTTDLSLIFDQFYIEWLRYSLAVRICEEWGATVPDATRAKYMEMTKKLMEVSPPDLSIQKREYFGSSAVWDWQTINLYKGFLPG